MKKRKSDGTLQAVTLLKLKLQLTGEQSAELSRIAELCRIGRNAGGIDWLLRQHGKPESRKQSERICKHAKHGDKPKSESSKIYHAVRAASPGLTGTIHSMIANQINSYLAGKLDWREGKTEDGKRPRRSNAILANNARPPFFTAIEIPVRAVDATFRFGDTADLICKLTACVETSVRIKTASLSGGQKRILHQLSAGERKLADSRILLKDNEWYWYVPFIFDQPKILTERQAELSPVLNLTDKDIRMERPYSLSLPDLKRPWGIGDGRYLIAQTRRIETLKKMIGYRYRNHEGKGHGRKQVDERKSRCSRHLANIVDEVRRRMIADVVRQCERNGCGTVLYHEPSLPLREKSWFAANGLDWDWTKFAANLKNSLARRGIALIVKTLKWKDATGNGQDAA